MTTARHVIFGTGAIGLATYDALRRRGETVRLVNRSGHAVADDTEVVAGDARDSTFTTAVSQGASIARSGPTPSRRMPHNRFANHRRTGTEIS